LPIKEKAFTGRMAISLFTDKRPCLSVKILQKIQKNVKLFLRKISHERIGAFWGEFHTKSTKEEKGERGRKGVVVNESKIPRNALG